jgi:hypothetical protein
MNCAIPDSCRGNLLSLNSITQAQTPPDARFAGRAETVIVLLIGLLSAGIAKSGAQSYTFAGNPQHTAQYPVRAQHLNRVFWSASVDATHHTSSSHYGAPLITASNTIIVPAVIAGTSGLTSSVRYNIKAYEGGTGRLKYTLTNDYAPPMLPVNPSPWWPVYQPVLVALPSALRLYYAGAGGTVYYVENPDSDTPSPPIQICFYTNLTGYASNAAAFNSSLFIVTPLTASTNGAIYFGYRGMGTVPPPMGTNRNGFVRIDADGSTIYALAAVAAGSSPLNCAPALSNDGLTVYVAAAEHYLLGLDAQTLATKYIRYLGARTTFNENITSSPTVGPDGDVYFAAGELFHFSGDLVTNKLPGFFGWDYTVAVVPSNLIPSYNGPSRYLLFCKYNDYSTRNRIALLDPNTPQFKYNFGTCMREVLTAFSPTPSGSSQTEWCINTAAVNPFTPVVFAPNEDGRVYRWDMAANSFSEVIALNAGVGEPYVPTTVGPDGTIYTITGSTLYAIGQNTNVDVTISSSMPDLTSVLPLQSLTFTAIVTNLNPSDPVPTGTVTFQDITYAPAIRVTNTLATNVVLSNYTAAVTVSTLSSNSGNHFITAIYGGDSNNPATSVSMVQKVHVMASSTQVASSIPYPGSNWATFLATVTNVGPSGPMRSGMVSFWDGTNFLSQIELSTNGQAGLTITNFVPGPHAIVARYFSDDTYTGSSGAVVGVPATLSQMQLIEDGSFVLGFTNVTGAPFTVLSSTDALASLGEWAVLGQASEISPGQFQYSDAQASTRDTVRFYRLRSP